MIHQIEFHVKKPIIYDPTTITIDITVWDMRQEIIKNTREIGYRYRA